MSSITLEEYLNAGIETLIKNILKATLRNPAQSAFFIQYSQAAKKAEKQRHDLALGGEHIPSFLIASITGRCNLNCSGCYDRANASCKCQEELSSSDWNRIFTEAEDAGISAILLAGGEPLMRPDIINEAAGHKTILFPVFTNGTMFEDTYISLFSKHRNLIPILSLEGNEAATDARRGPGIYRQALDSMGKLSKKNLLFGTSITVTKENITAVTSAEFIENLWDIGCRAVIFVEYVPVTNREIALDESGREYMASAIQLLRKKSDMLILSFPGDEKEAGGCLAAGRGFFHINASGGAEPCPFSPYSDINLRNASLREALNSPLFIKLKSNELLSMEHTGGCTLFEQEQLVRSLL